MGKIYETKEDREAEVEIVRHLIRGKEEAVKLPRMNHADWAIVSPDGEVAALLEIKDRPGWLPRYKYIMMNLDKWAVLCSISNCTISRREIAWGGKGVPCYFVIRVPEGIFYTQVVPSLMAEVPPYIHGTTASGVERARVGTFCRKDQGEDGFRLVVEIPFDHFIEISGPETPLPWVDHTPESSRRETDAALQANRKRNERWENGEEPPAVTMPDH